MRTVSLAAPSDVIALSWYRLGYRPRDSLVMVGLSGPRNRSGLVVRADLTPHLSSQDLADALAGMLPPLWRSGASAVVAVVHRDGVVHGASPVMVERIVDAVNSAVIDEGLVLADLVGVDETRYRSLMCRDRACCPPGGRPLSDITDSRAAVSFVAEGAALAPDEAALVADVLPAASVAVAPVVPLTAPQWLAAWVGVLAGPDPAFDVPRRAARATDWTDGRARAFAVAVREVSLRDAALCALMTDDARVPEAMLRNDAGRVGRRATRDEEGVAAFGGLEAMFGCTPTLERVERGRRLLAQAARVCRSGERAEPLAMLAWLAWWCGDGPRARLLAQRALDDRPGHRLAGLVAQLLTAGVPPPWVEEWGPEGSSMSKR